MSFKSPRLFLKPLFSPIVCSACSPSRIHRIPPCLVRHASSAPVPETLRPSFWNSMIPKFLRRTEPKSPQEIKAKEWNPATFYIIIFLLIGSQSIRMIALRNESRNFSSKAEAKLGVLREVIEKLQKGEDVDVERLLGTGDAAKEREWEEVLREIEEEDSLWHSKRRSNRKGTNNPANEPETMSPEVDQTVSSMSKIPRDVKDEEQKTARGNFY